MNEYLRKNSENIPIGYFKDAMHNYMVLPVESSSTEKDYRYRMIAANHIEGLLPCGIRKIDGNKFLYYEITSRQRLDIVIENRGLNYPLLKCLLLNIAETGEALARYLLDRENLLLSPEYIYYDLKMKKFSFTYYPYDKGNIYSERQLCHCLADRVDQTDKDAVRLIYRICAEAQNDDFMLRREEIETKKSGKPDGEKRKENEHPEKKASMKRESRSTYAEEGRGAPSDFGVEEERESPRIRPQEEDDGKHEFLIPLVSGIVLCVLRRFLDLNIMGRRLSAAAVFASFLIAGISFCSYLKRKNRGANKKKKKTGKHSSRRKNNERRSYVLRNAVEEEREEHSGAIPQYMPDDEPEKDQRPRIDRDTDEAIQPLDEETQYLPQYRTVSRSLIGLNGWKKINIAENRLPCTVGKTKKYANIAVEEESVSRMHARIYKEGDDFAVEDLNSTNGTWINGHRLSPNGSAVLVPGDIVKFGSVEFEYR